MSLRVVQRAADAAKLNPAASASCNRARFSRLYDFRKTTARRSRLCPARPQLAVLAAFQFCWQGDRRPSPTACGLALVIALQLTGMPFVEQSARGTGGDYWLGNDRSGNVIFQRAARLEVSGILQGDVSSPLAEGLCKRKRRLGPRWPWSRFQFGTTRQKRRCGIFLFVLSEQDNREVQRLDLPPHVVHL